MDNTFNDNTDAPSLSALKADVQQLKSDIAQLMDTIKRTATDATAGVAYDAAAVPSDKLDELSLCIQERPLKSVAIAAGVGAFLGIILLR
ncbi:hypothetical protein GCM10007301_29380 [Azorhizobium oxalatiphilum]|uniref:DUF883 domain-containing protein n=1 Tax=Azorhizobium oxalatiphilum TaxID=980631 RepID=A0A917FEG4_9HYPH|nr:hypothetical protein [Azorhizobium oxalatiphilum]GGF67796.1 hypothetical protein GCM10007301_29380 [Azorhizobium oxalatiphilum]